MQVSLNIQTAQAGKLGGILNTPLRAPKNNP
jgi:hypothetical protein